MRTNLTTSDDSTRIAMPGKAVGWGAVEDAVRADDERQVQSCKDDIDSLLTFAGLYSAALTALLALSFGMLQEDVAGESLQVLRQIAQQTANYQLLPGGTLNTTAVIPPPSSSPFEPSPGALRVNILWFTSLVFSLSTASIGILVKQWLRAYTSYQTSSAQGRMRVRHFRRQGMETWKVYEIAAVLPLFIQLALGLFFVGLCYFTAEVHPDLRNATLPLVAGWALFIFVVTVLPIVSAHCPYKPALFEGLFSVIRPRLFSCIAETLICTDGLIRRLFSLASRISTSISRPMRRLKYRVFPDLDSSSMSTDESSVEPFALLIRCISYIFGYIAGPNSLTARATTRLKRQFSLGSPTDRELEQSVLGRLALRARSHTRKCADINRPHDETDAVTYADKDVSILVSADALQSDDELLGTAIFDALKQSRPTLSQTATFLLGALQSRGIPPDGRQLQLEDEPALLDCRSLTLRARTAIVDIVTQISGSRISEACTNSIFGEVAEWKETQWTLCIILSPSQHPLSSICLQFLGKCLLGYNERMGKNVLAYMVKTSDKPADQTVHLLLRVARHYCESMGHDLATASDSDAAGNMALESAVKTIWTIMDSFLHDANIPYLDSRYAVFDDTAQARDCKVAGLRYASLHETSAWIIGLLQRSLEPPRTQWPPAQLLERAVSLAFRLEGITFTANNEDWAYYRYINDPYGPARVAVFDVVSRMCTRESPEHLELAIRCYVSQPSTFLPADHPFISIFMPVDSPDEEYLRQVYQAVVNITDDLLSNCQKPSVVAKRLAWTMIQMLCVTTTYSSAPILRWWRKIFRCIVLALESRPEEGELGEGIKGLVHESLRCIDKLDVARGARGTFRATMWYAAASDDEITEKDWRIQFKPAESPFSSHLVHLLSKQLPNLGRKTFNSWRMRLLRDRIKEEGLREVINDDEHDDDPEESVAGDTMRTERSGTVNSEQTSESPQRKDDEDIGNGDTRSQ